MENTNLPTRMKRIDTSRFVFKLMEFKIHIEIAKGNAQRQASILHTFIVT